MVSFGLAAIASEDGPIEIAPGTHLLPRPRAAAAVEAGDIRLEPVPLAVGDVLIRNPWTLHRGTPKHDAHPEVPGVDPVCAAMVR